VEASSLIQYREEGSHENTKNETLIEFRVLRNFVA